MLEPKAIGFGVQFFWGIEFALSCETVRGHGKQHCVVLVNEYILGERDLQCETGKMVVMIDSSGTGSMCQISGVT
jgi:hypothetical protein